MSQNSDQRRARSQSARERLREDRAREQAAKKRMRTLKVGIAVVGVLATVGLVGVLATQGGGESEDAAGKPAVKPITEGRASAPVTLSIYEDFRCPGCAQFEQGFKDTIGELREAGKVKVDYHLVSIVDRQDNGSGSANAANAAACAKDAGHFTAYHDTLFANQPTEGGDAFADAKNLIKLAGKVDGLDSSTFRACVNDKTHEDWVTRSSAAFLESGYDATPTLLMDGENLSADRSSPFTPEMLVNKVEEAAGKS